jgi:hypothetical protein
LATHEKLFLKSETDGQIYRKCEVAITKLEVQFVGHPPGSSDELGMTLLADTGMTLPIAELVWVTVRASGRQTHGEGSSVCRDSFKKNWRDSSLSRHKVPLMRLPQLIVRCNLLHEDRLRLISRFRNYMAHSLLLRCG